MPPSLEQILAATRRRIERERGSADAQRLRTRALAHRPRGFESALRQRAATGTAVIAELKKASPSNGVFRGTFPVARLAAELEQAGAAALSVLTDEEFFQGSLANLAEASAASALPCLRKDFILDEFQLLQARAYCADAVLLIAAALSVEQLGALRTQARALELDVLCEVHDQRELESALRAGCELIGVNSRDLRTFKTDRGTLLRLAKQVPENVLAVAESGIQSSADLRELVSAGYRTFLIGEALMRAESPGAALRGLLEGFANSSARIS